MASLISIPSVTVSSGAVIALITWLYQRRKYAKSVTRQLGLEKFSTYVFKGFVYRLVGFLRPRAAASLSLREFALNRLAVSPAKVYVPAAVPVELSLDEMFVPLTVFSSEHARVSASQVAYGGYHRVLLVGDPGSGKSTLVRRIYRDICRDAIASTFGGRIPVLIELKNLDRYSKPKGEPNQESLSELIRRQVTSVRTYSGDDLYESFLNDGRVTIMLDGLDEVKTSDFDAVSEEIAQLCDYLARKNKDNLVIVTTRRQLYVNLPEEFSSTFEAHLTLDPFTADDMYEFLRKWPYKQHSEQEFGRIFGNLASQPNIRSMCQTPLILAMYVATDQLTGGEGLPETRPDFYKAVTDELLVRRRGRQLGLTTGLNLLRRNRQQLLGRLALEHLLDGKQSRNALRWDAAVKIVQEQEGLSSDDAGRRLRELSRDTGLFTEEKREESLRFIHLTFCEFLAAQAIVQGSTEAWDVITESVEAGAQGISSKRFVERFAEVIVFAIALEKNEHIRRQRVRWAVQSGGVDIALRAILDSQPYDDKFVLLELKRVADAVADAPQDDRDENWFHLFRQVAMILRDRELVGGAITGGKPHFLAPFFMRTVGDSSTGFRPLFLAYMRLDPAGALELARTMEIQAVTEYPSLLAKALDEPAVLAHALGRFTSDENGTRMWASILAIGALYHRSVARRLSSMKAQDELDQRVSRGVRGRGWQRCWVTRGTVLGTVLEAGCRWPASSTFLALMATAPARRSKLAESILNRKWPEYLGWAVFVSAGLMISRRIADLPVVVGGVSASTFAICLCVWLAWRTFRFLKRNSPSPTAELLNSRRMLSPPMTTDADEYALLLELVVAVAADPTIRTLHAIRLVRRQKYLSIIPLYWPERSGGSPTSWSERLVRRVPPAVLWSPNLRLNLLIYLAPYLQLTEAGDQALPETGLNEMPYRSVDVGAEGLVPPRSID